MHEQELNEYILDDMLKCNELCNPLGNFRSKLDGLTDYEKIKFFEKVLPGLDYVKRQLVFYIFSNGITTGSINEDVDLDKFLYRKNEEGATNITVLQDLIGTCSVYGEAGLRWYNDNIYCVKAGTYAPLLIKEDGVKKIFAWIVSEDGSYLKNADFNTKEIPLTSWEEFIKYFRERRLLLLSTDEFMNVRNDSNDLHGTSPLLRDELRLSLLVATYERLNYDINYDGPGRLILKAKDGYVEGDNNDISTGEVMNQSMKAQNNRYERAKKEAQTIAEQIKNSTSDQAIVLSNAFKDNITHLPRVTKATEFFDWLKQEGVILAQDLGMSPSLLELGDISGNVSMEKIIDNSMLNTIVPLREMYSTQFSEFIASKIGVTKIYFDKYEMQQAENVHETQMKIVDMMDTLYNIGEESLVQDFAEMLRDSIHDENNDIRALSVGMKKKEKKDGEKNG